MRPAIRDFLGQCPTVSVSTRLDLGAGSQLTVWENDAGRISYDGPEGHVFCLYLKGGTNTYRLDKGARCGWPGAVCLLPEGHRSEWSIEGYCQFLHFYVPDRILRATYSRIHDRDSRLLDPRDMTFVEEPEMAHTLARMVTVLTSGDVLEADTAIANLIGLLPGRSLQVRGGLTPRVLRNIDAYIDANIEHTIRLDTLAEIADLSEFHFHRMFRQSRGVAPHEWVTMRRMEMAKSMLRSSAPIAGISSACGFSSQSHMTRTFAKHCGTTPAKYRRLALSP